MCSPQNEANGNNQYDKENHHTSGNSKPVPEICNMQWNLSRYIQCMYILYEKSKIPFSYMLYAYSVKEPIGELNLKRAFG